MTADDLARAYHDHYRRLAAGSYPAWDGMQSAWRREKVAAYQSMLDAGWTFTAPARVAACYTYPKENP